MRERASSRSEKRADVLFVAPLHRRDHLLVLFKAYRQDGRTAAPALDIVERLRRRRSDGQHRFVIGCHRPAGLCGSTAHRTGNSPTRPQRLVDHSLRLQPIARLIEHQALNRNAWETLPFHRAQLRARRSCRSLRCGNRRMRAHGLLDGHTQSLFNIACDCSGRNKR